MPSVFDAGAAVAFLRDEPGAERVEAALTDEADACYIHAVNLAEVYYVVARDEDEGAANEAIRTLVVEAGLRVRRDIDAGFCQEVGRLRAWVRSHGWRIALADCFCLATARRLGARLLTADEREFRVLIPLGWCPIEIITDPAA
jgi:PIN domain nuclease of toxin-antitoxin system